MRRGTEKRIKQRKMMVLSDLATNTRKRRRLARRLLKEEPLFAFEFLSSQIPGYSYLTFERDTRPTRGSRRRGKRVYTNRMAFHDELLNKLDPQNPDNKIITKLMLNWENMKKPMIIEVNRNGERLLFKCPKEWSLTQVRSTFKGLQGIKTIDDLNAYWNKHTSHGR